MSLFAKVLETFLVSWLKNGKPLGSTPLPPKLTEGEAGKAFTPALKRIAQTANHVTSVSGDLIDLSLNAIELLMHVPRRVVDRSLARIKKKWPEIDATQTAHLLQTVDNMPIQIEDGLETAWENLLVNSVTDLYHPIYSKILAEITTNEAKLLRSLVAMSAKGTTIVPSAFTIENIDPSFFVNKRLQLKRLGLALTILERQKLVATANNLGTYFENKRTRNQRSLDPVGYQVTSLGQELYQACAPESRRVNRKQRSV